MTIAQDFRTLNYLAQLNAQALYREDNVFCIVQVLSIETTEHHLKFSVKLTQNTGFLPPKELTEWSCAINWQYFAGDENFWVSDFYLTRFRVYFNQPRIEALKAYALNLEDSIPNEERLKLLAEHYASLYTEHGKR